MKRMLWANIAMCAIAWTACGQTVSGKIVDALSGEPVQGATITVLELKKTFSASPMGDFTSDTLSKGTFSLRAEAKNYLTQTRSIILSDKTGAGSDHIVADFSLYNISSNADAAKGGMSIKYYFPGHSDVEITITDSKGKVVRKAFDRSRSGGTKTFEWDGNDNGGKPVPAGTYGCNLTSRNLVTIRSLVWEGKK
jgi:hypothetical protein